MPPPSSSAAAAAAGARCLTRSTLRTLRGRRPHLRGARHDRRYARRPQGSVERRQVATEHLPQGYELLLEVGGEHLEHGVGLRRRSAVHAAGEADQTADPLDQLRGEVERILERAVAHLVELLLDRAQPLAESARGRAKAHRVGCARELVLEPLPYVSDRGDRRRRRVDRVAEPFQERELLPQIGGGPFLPRGPPEGGATPLNARAARPTP